MFTGQNRVAHLYTFTVVINSYFVNKYVVPNKQIIKKNIFGFRSRISYHKIARTTFSSQISVITN